MEEKIERLLSDDEFRQYVKDGELFAAIGMARGYLKEYENVYALLQKIGDAATAYNAKLLDRGAI